METGHGMDTWLKKLTRSIRNPMPTYANFQMHTQPQVISGLFQHRWASLFSLFDPFANG